MVRAVLIFFNLLVGRCPGLCPIGEDRNDSIFKNFVVSDSVTSAVRNTFDLSQKHFMSYKKPINKIDPVSQRNGLNTGSEK